MTKLTQNEKITNYSAGFGGWAAMILINVVINGVIGIVTNSLNIANSTKKNTETKVNYNNVEKATYKLF